MVVKLTSDIRIPGRNKVKSLLEESKHRFSSVWKGSLFNFVNKRT